MKHFFGFLFLFTVSLSGFSQSAEQYVVCSGADTARLPGYNFHMTVGEAVIATLSQRYTIITQGFEQADITTAPAVPSGRVMLTGKIAGSVVLLTWTTPFEINNHHFSIERATDTLNGFSQISTLPSRYANGTNSTPTTYNNTDSFPKKSINYYRIKMIARDQSVSYSNTIALVMDEADVWLQNLYPNPARENVNVKIFSKVATRAIVTITDMLTRPMVNKTIDLTPGNNIISFAIENLAAGVYYVHLTDPKTGKQMVAKLIKATR